MTLCDDITSRVLTREHSLTVVPTTLRAERASAGCVSDVKIKVVRGCPALDNSATTSFVRGRSIPNSSTAQTPPSLIFIESAHLNANCRILRGIFWR